MKRKLFSLGIIGTVSIIFFLGEVKGENLLVNPSFEDGVYSPDRTPPGWHTWGPDKFSQKWDNNVSYHGTKSVSLFDVKKWATWYSDPIPLDKTKSYIASAYVKVEDMEEALAQAEAAGLAMTMDGAGFGRDGDGHYAYLDTESQLGVTIELIQRPKGRMPPEHTKQLDGRRGAAQLGSN